MIDVYDKATEAYRLAKADVDERVKVLNSNHEWFVYQGVIDVTENIPFSEIAEYYGLSDLQYETLIDETQTLIDSR
jgi:hypothetical protein